MTVTAKINKLNRNFLFAIGTIAACTISGCQVNYKTAYETINSETMAKKEAKRSEQAITKYGKYAKETEFMTSGEFCEEMTDPAASFIYSSVPGGGWQYWSKIIEGRYTVLGLETTTRQDKQQLKNAYKTWKKVLNNCDW